MCPDADVHRFTAFGGARCEILARGAMATEISACVAEVYAFESRLSRFRPGSELSRFNAAAGMRVAVSPLLEELLRTALDAHVRTDGLVNAAVLPALVAAGYDRSIEMVRRRDALGLAAMPLHHANTPRVPPLDEVLRVGDGWAHLASGCAIDLGGVGKGWLADRLAERLEDAAVNLGGDVRVIGAGPRATGWGVALCDGTSVRLRGGGVATSGTEGRRWRGGHHLVDPRTGAPSATDVLALSVVAADAETAETLAKAAVLLGSSAAPHWLQVHGACAWAMRATAGAGAVELQPEPA